MLKWQLPGRPGWTFARQPAEMAAKAFVGQSLRTQRPVWTETTEKGRYSPMLTVLLALLLLITLAWALHDSRTVVERHKGVPRR
ncbi:hypothetical protein A5705_13410 [Mycobacterium sp. E787]|nr:hypothetical protein A5705_13410 [Mycobacterium sp. E787]